MASEQDRAQDLVRRFLVHLGLEDDEGCAGCVLMAEEAFAAVRREALEAAAKKCDAKRVLASGDFRIIPAELAFEIRKLAAAGEA